MPSKLEQPSTNVFRAAFQAFARFMSPKPPQEVVVDEDGVRRLRAGEVIERVRWAHLTNVTIATTDEGPFVEDFFWLLRESNGSGCAISGGQAEASGLLEKLQKLPRFNDEAVIVASGSTSNALFVCWDGSPGEGVACA
jgi:hypothetical protein